MSTIVAAISTPMLTYIHFSGPGPNAARGNTAARALRSTTRKQQTSAPPAASKPAVVRAVRGTPARLMASAAAPSNSSDHTGIRVSAVVMPLLSRGGRAPGTNADFRVRGSAQPLVVGAGG